MEVIMHNLISYNQLAEWKNFEETVDRCNEQNELINDYFNCLIECDEEKQTCKRICRELLSHS
jgi:Trp operon repressor